MEATQSVSVQRLQAGFVDVKSFGYPESQNPQKSGVVPVQSADQIDLRTRDQVDAKKQEQQQKHAKNSEDIFPSLMQEIENKINQMQEIGLEFTRHKDSGRTIIKVVEKGSNKVIREIPSEEFLDLVVKMDQMIGILYDKKA